MPQSSEALAAKYGTNDVNGVHHHVRSISSAQAKIEAATQFRCASSKPQLQLLAGRVRY